MTDARRTRLRGILGVLAVAALSIGVPATVAPRDFYDGFPFFAHWVDRLPPYNEHLVTDVGELQLAFGLVFTWAAWSPDRRLVVPVCAAYALSQALHLAFHVAHLQRFDAPDAAAQIASLVALTLAPLPALALASRR